MEYLNLKKFAPIGRRRFNWKSVGELAMFRRACVPKLALSISSRLFLLEFLDYTYTRTAYCYTDLSLFSDVETVRKLNNSFKKSLLRKKSFLSAVCVHCRSRQNIGVFERFTAIFLFIYFISFNRDIKYVLITPDFESHTLKLMFGATNSKIAWIFTMIWNMTNREQSVIAYRKKRGNSIGIYAQLISKNRILGLKIIE